MDYYRYPVYIFLRLTFFVLARVEINIKKLNEWTGDKGTNIYQGGDMVARA